MGNLLCAQLQLYRQLSQLNNIWKEENISVLSRSGGCRSWLLVFPLTSSMLIDIFYWNDTQALTINNTNYFIIKKINLYIVDDAILWCTWGAVVGREPEFGVKSLRGFLTSPQIPVHVQLLHPKCITRWHRRLYIAFRQRRY